VEALGAEVAAGPSVIKLFTVLIYEGFVASQRIYPCQALQPPRLTFVSKTAD
jgi:hypothetical protein